MDSKGENQQAPPFERPLECSECRKPITVHYMELVGNARVHVGHCSECPVLQRKLQGAGHLEGAVIEGKNAGLVCGECGTTLDSFRVSRTVGCSNCYEVFGDLILEEMFKTNKISPGLSKGKMSVPLHIGRTPGEMPQISPSLQLIALNQALEETLKLEDYEQAALLRDQIKALTQEEKDKDASKE